MPYMQTAYFFIFLELRLILRALEMSWSGFSSYIVFRSFWKCWGQRDTYAMNTEWI